MSLRVIIGKVVLALWSLNSTYQRNVILSLFLVIRPSMDGADIKMLPCIALAHAANPNGPIPLVLILSVVVPLRYIVIRRFKSYLFINDH